MANRFFRYDAGKLKKARITPQGYLKADAFITRSGIFIYRKPDGSIQKEFRPPEEVYRKESLDSLAEISITNDHPQNPLDVENTKMLAVGFTGSNVMKVDDYVAGSTTVYDKQAITDIMDSGKRELSAGYTCEIDSTPGIFQGVKYDAIQRNIIYNHVAIVRQGRAGPGASFKMDAQDAFMIDEDKEDAEWTTAYINSLPDSAFGYIEPGDKDEEGKTEPRAKRHFPYKNSNGEIDLPHLRNALARAPQSPFGKLAMPKLSAAAKKSGVGQEKKDCESSEESLTSKSTVVNQSSKGAPVMPKITIDSIEHELTPELAKHIAKLSKDISDSEKEKEKLAGKVDALEAVIQDAKAKPKGKDKEEEEEDDEDMEEGEESKESDKKDKGKKDKRKDGVQKMDRKDAIAYGREWVEVEAFAKSSIGDSFKSDGLDLIDMKKAVVVKKFSKEKIEGKSDEYVSAMFDTLRENTSNPKAQALKDGFRNIKTDTVDPVQVRMDYMEKQQARWQRPLFERPSDADEAR